MEENKLKVVDFLNRLQLEYFTHLLRSKIYEEPVFVKMHKDIAQAKREKILQVSAIKHVPCIFNDEKLYEDVLQNQFLQPYGLPNFIYNPLKKDCSFYDRKYIFQEGRKVRYKGVEYPVFRNYAKEGMIDIYIGEHIQTLRYTDVELVLEDLLGK